MEAEAKQAKIEGGEEPSDDPDEQDDDEDSDDRGMVLGGDDDQLVQIKAATSVPHSEQSDMSSDSHRDSSEMDESEEDSI